MIYSINPYNQNKVFEHHLDGKKTLRKKLNQTEKAFGRWKSLPLTERVDCILRLEKIILEQLPVLAHTATIEMGKPIAEAEAEIQKCADCCGYFAKHAEKLFADRIAPSYATESYITHAATGAVLGIMPWNFPYWQVIRFAIPALLSGNVVLLKHAPNTWQCAKLLEACLLEAGIPKGVFTCLFISVNQVEGIIANPLVTGIAFTGSVAAGRQVAALAGFHLKKCTLELGGNNALLVFPDADVDAAIEAIFTGRLMNNGQSCIAVKRAIVHTDVYETVLQKLKGGFKARQSTMGDPLKSNTQTGPLARKDLAKQLEKQVKEIVEDGGKIIVGGKRMKCFYSPTLLAVDAANAAAQNQELFGPVLCLIQAKDEKEMIQISNHTPFGLGVSLFTQDVEKAKKIAHNMNEGQVFINDIVKSNPALPFGGVKNSGIGKELGTEGALEFVNKKTIVVH